MTKNKALDNQKLPEAENLSVRHAPPRQFLRNTEGISAVIIPDNSALSKVRTDFQTIMQHNRQQTERVKEAAQRAKSLELTHQEFNEVLFFAHQDIEKTTNPSDMKAAQEAIKLFEYFARFSFDITQIESMNAKDIATHNEHTKPMRAMVNPRSLTPEQVWNQT
jgi:hypothetical protein